MSAPASIKHFLPSPSQSSCKQKEGTIVLQRPLFLKYVLRLPKLMVPFAMGQYPGNVKYLGLPTEEFLFQCKGKKGKGGFAILK